MAVEPRLPRPILANEDAIGPFIDWRALRLRLWELGFNQRVFAKEVGVSYPIISAAMTGLRPHTTLHVRYLTALAIRHLHLDPHGVIISGHDGLVDYHRLQES